jgi:hypothetical protein
MMSVSAGLHVGGGDWRGVMRERCDAMLVEMMAESKRCDAATQKKKDRLATIITEAVRVARGGRMEVNNKDYSRHSRWLWLVRSVE